MMCCCMQIKLLDYNLQIDQRVLKYYKAIKGKLKHQTSVSIGILRDYLKGTVTIILWHGIMCIVNGEEVWCIQLTPT